VKGQTRNNEFVDIHALRKLYNFDAIGQSKTKMLISITPNTKDMLDTIVPIGKGSYGSPFIELAIRLLVSLIFESDQPSIIGSEILDAIDSPYIPGNLRSLANYIESRSVFKTGKLVKEKRISNNVRDPISGKYKTRW
jgi:hypothetical protein